MSNEKYFASVTDDGIEYFETGCLCYLSGRIEKGNSYEYYFDNCTCSRHPESASRICWDREDKVARQEALATAKCLHSEIFV